MFMADSSLLDHCVVHTATLLEAAKAIEKGTNRTVLVVDSLDTMKVMGVLSEGDVLRALIRGTDIHSPMKEFVRVQFRYLTEPDDKKALDLFAAHGISLLPIVDKNMHLKAVVTIIDALRRCASV